MRVTLLDEKGVELTEITSHLGRSPGQLLVDWATRPDALFRYYFDRGRRTVTAVVGAATWSATLGTRWQMGARFWFLHTFRRVRAAVSGPGAPSKQDSGRIATRIPNLYVKNANAVQRAPALVRASEPRGAPA